MRDDDSGCAATSAIITPDLIVCGNAEILELSCQPMDLLKVII